MKRKVYQELAALTTARKNCAKSGNWTWYSKHGDRIDEIIDNFPHGSGIDGDTTFDHDNSNGEKLVINSSYHAMDDAGGYDRWIDYRITLTPSLQFGFNIKIVGNFGKYQDIKDYLYDVYQTHLDGEIED